jgi:hypothetical protein
MTAAKADAQSDHHHPEQPVDKLQASNRSRSNPLDQPSRLFLETVAFGESDRRKSKDEESDEPLIGEGSAKSVDNAGRRVGSDERHPRDETRHQARGHDDHGYAKTKRKADEDDSNSN